MIKMKIQERRCDKCGARVEETSGDVGPLFICPPSGNRVWFDVCAGCSSKILSEVLQGVKSWQSDDRENTIR